MDPKLDAALKSTWPGAATRFLALRLLPGADLRQALEQAFAAEREHAGFIVACVGSLSKVSLRPAGLDSPLALEVTLEIVSLSGTFSEHGPHLHIAVSDSSGAMLGGHLLEGSLVRTTVEVVIGLAPVHFRRMIDPRTGYPELQFD
ncbi:DNA-binding protein [Alloyangia pacifica]|uniref:DNA-binding protein n=1 Tax=Alloyangia pacifica TaxID=311180 RepID=A0A2U8HAD4_9RHOB|nr:MULTISPECIES: PPC domain-containing DNA-binding protein [Roseobacteraceae]AWI82741.1 DNA-binding protein [Alloyangia pacifica]NDV48056.1 DNA-binding protein [Salipiger sp. PrR003]NDW33248.1 DNA-binding protein [Salipiger sp. PrR007]